MPSLTITSDITLQAEGALRKSPPSTTDAMGKHSSSYPRIQPRRGSLTTLRSISLSLPHPTCYAESLCSTADIVKHVLRSATSHFVEELPTERTVHFELSRNEYMPADTQPLTEEEISLAWWTPQDYADSHKVSSQEALSFVTSHAEGVRGLSHAVSTCHQASSDQLADEETLSQSLAEAATAVRGMETDVVPGLKTSRERHGKAVLEYIGKIPERLPQDLRDRMLSSRSMQYSRPHKIFAQLLGTADAISCN